MPELPEVETVRATLYHQILNKTIAKIDIYYQRIIENVSVDTFTKTLIGQTIKDIKRYGKYLIFIFDDVSLIAHLRMEGKFFLKPHTEPIVKHEHIVFTFTDNLTLRYHDTRKFGRMALINSTSLDEVMKYPALAKLGLEANSDKITGEYLYQKIKNKHEPIKVALLNQEILAGLGNIYVDEVCFMAKLNPATMCTYLNIDDCNHIIENSKVILAQAVLAGGTTIRSYTSSLGVTGLFQLSLHVHTLDGKQCENCKSTIIKTVVGGRGTYYCPTCQKQIKPQVIGITGSIASGKSSVTAYLIKLGYEVIDSDKIVHDLLKNPSIIIKIKDLFGDTYIENNKINHELLGNLIFNNEQARKQLNELIHPLVKTTILNKIKNSNKLIIFVDVPLLYEAHFEDLFDKIFVVYVDESTQLTRLMNRDQITLDLAQKKINSQIDMETKKHLTNYLIDNSLDLCYTYKQIDELLKKI